MRHSFPSPPARPLHAVMLMVMLASALPAAASAQGAGPGPLTVEDAVRLALEQNPGVLASRQQVAAADARVQGAFGHLLPTLRFSGMWNFAEKVQTIPNPFASLGGPATLTIDFTQDYQGGVDLSFPVYTWGANMANYQDARTGLESARSTAAASEADVALEVTRAYYGVVLAERGVAVARDALAQAERQEQIAASRAEQGAASEFEHLRARVQTANLRPAVVRAEAGLRQARIGLNLLLGLEPAAPVEITGGLTYQPVTLALEALKEEALQARQDLQAARLASQRSELAVRMARATRMPSLLVSGSYGFRADDAALSKQFNDNYAMNLLVAIPLFDGFSARSMTGQAVAGREQARLAVEQTERAVIAQVEQAYYDLKAAEESYLVQADNVRQAERALQIAQVSFENGIIMGVELMDSQLALTFARQNQDQTLYDYRVALARIRRAVGRPLP